jgi:hypothetical protein
MQRCRFPLALFALAGLVLPAPAGIFFNRSAKPSAMQRVPALLATVRTDPNERAREAAAEELGHCDPRAYPEVVPVLIEVLQQDASAGVRLEAAKTLSELRPVSQQAGWALEQAADKDATLRVRVQARRLLWHYHLSGYRSSGKIEGPPPAPVKTSEPPLAPPAENSAPAPAQAPRLVPVPSNPTATSEPPAAPVTAPQPLPRGPEKGPELNPPE